MFFLFRPAPAANALRLSFRDQLHSLNGMAVKLKRKVGSIFRTAVFEGVKEK
jgi:hypothetical protein